MQASSVSFGSARRLCSVSCALVLSVLTLCVVPIAPLHGYTVDDKLKLEQAFAVRATDILENLLGKGNVISFVDINLETVQTQKSKEVYNVGTPQSPSGKWTWQAESAKKYILPGYPTKDSVGGGFAEQAGKYERITEQQYELPQTVIKRMAVTIVVDTKVEPGLLESVPNIVGSLLGMDRRRGDTIMVQRMSFPPPESFLRQFRKPEIVVDVAKFAIISVFLLAALVVFFVLLRTFLADLSEMMQAMRIKVTQEINPKVAGKHEGESPADGLQREVLPEKMTEKIREYVAPPEPAPSLPSPGAERHFNFVNELNLHRLSFLLRDEVPDKIAITLSYLLPKDAASVLSQLDPSKRTQVTAKLSQIFETDPTDVVEWEKKVQDKINYVLGGNELMSEVLDTADDMTREQLLADIATRDPRKAEEFRNNLFLFDNLAYLDDEEMRLLLSKIDNQKLAFALQGASNKIITKVFNNKTEGAQKILQETMDLAGRQPPKVIQEARHHIVAVAKQLIREGFLVHRKLKKVDAYVMEEGTPQ